MESTTLYFVSVLYYGQVWGQDLSTKCWTFSDSGLESLGEKSKGLDMAVPMLQDGADGQLRSVDDDANELSWTRVQ